MVFSTSGSSVNLMLLVGSILLRWSEKVVRHWTVSGAKHPALRVHRNTIPWQPSRGSLLDGTQHTSRQLDGTQRASRQPP